MASSNPWDPVQPSAAALLLRRCLSSGAVREKALDFSHRETPCFTRISELERLVDIKAEIDQKSLEIELLRLEQETADIAHPLYLRQKCEALQAMNSHLESVIKEKRSLKLRLAKPMCYENLPIEANYHRDAVELLTLAVTFIEKLEVYLQTIRKIPQIDECVRNMDNSLVRMESLEIEVEELAERIIKWRGLQSEIHHGTSKVNMESILSATGMTPAYLSMESLPH